MKKKKMRLKGKLRLYMNWPLIMTFLLVAMNIWVLMVDRKAAFIMFMFILIYLAIAGGLYFYNRSLILADLIQFSTQYKGIENTLLKELAVPYAIALEDGRILWKNDAFSKLTQSSRKEKYLYRMIPALTTSVFPKDDMEHVEMEVEYCDRHYQAELRRVSLHGFSDKEKLLQIPEEEEFFVAVSMQDVTELNAYIRENEEQRMIAGLIYIDNYDEVMESVEEVRQSLLVALIDRKINKYIGDVDGIVKKMEKDKYFIVLRKSAYKKIAEDRFSLLEEVKQVNIGNARSATLSIGLGLNTATYALSYQYARVAIDLALARGGEQEGAVELLLAGVEVDQQVDALVHDFCGARIGAVDLVDADDGAVTQLQRLAQHKAGLGHGAFKGVHQQDHAVHHLQHALDLAAEVGVAGSVDDVDVHAVVFHAGVLGQYRDAAFALDIAGVHHALGHLLVFAEHAGLAQHLVDQRRLAVVNVRNDGNIADILSFHHSHMLQISFISYPCSARISVYLSKTC